MCGLKQLVIDAMPCLQVMMALYSGAVHAQSAGVLKQFNAVHSLPSSHWSTVIFSVGSITQDVTPLSVVLGAKRACVE